MPFERTYTKKDLEMDMFLPSEKKTLIENALLSGKSVTIVHSSFKDSGSDYSDIVLDGVVIHHQLGY